MKKEKDLIQDISNHLDKSVDLLDSATLSKIRSVRYDALHKGKSRWISFGLPIGGLATAAIAVYFAITFYTVQDMKPNNLDLKVLNNKIAVKKSNKAISPEMKIQPSQVELVEIFTEDPKLEFFKDIEFYTWLAENPDEKFGS
ncbi:MAG: hypothetical protein GY705_31055 [Bacteroidetes bacterium]|nr:hypothetical protein [Bacteroidota bacterium]